MLRMIDPVEEVEVCPAPPKPMTLPDKASDLIRVGMWDLEKCLIDPHYEIRMGLWHDPIVVREGWLRRAYVRRCGVCLAGAVMAQSLEVNWTVIRRPFGFGAATDGKLAALDQFRKGDLRAAFRHMGYADPPPLEDRPMPSHGFKASARWRRAMYKLADDLEAAGC